MTDLPLPPDIRSLFETGELTTAGALDIEPPPEPPRHAPAEPPPPEEERQPAKLLVFRCRECGADCDGDGVGEHDPGCHWGWRRMADVLGSFNVPPPPSREVLDPAAARVATEEAIERVERNADEAWKERARSLTHRICLTRPTFTADDLWAAGLDKPREPRALGPVLRHAALQGWCEATGEHLPSQRPEHHRYPMRQYRSLIFGRS